MVTKELLDFIASERKKGLTDAVIREELLKTNWAPEDIDAAFQSLNTGTPTPTTPPSPQVDAKTLIVILALVLFYPIGIILMWWWMKKWPLWVKLLISMVLVVFFVLLLLPIFLVILLPKAPIHGPAMRENSYTVSPTQATVAYPTTLPASSGDTSNVKGPNGSGVCTGDNGCKFRSPGSGYRCDENGTFDATQSSHFCTCDASCNVHVQ